MISQRQLLLRKFRSVLVVGASGTAVFGGVGIWTGNEKFYEQFVSPILNRIDPEVSHRAAIFVTKLHLLRPSQLEEPLNLKARIGSLAVSNPIGIAAGFDKSAECMSGLVRMGLGWIEIGSVTPWPQDGNPKPRVFRLPKDSAVINRYGFNNEGHEKVHERVKQFKLQYPNYIIGVNLGANKDSLDRTNDYCAGIKVFSDSADYFVINISSPNTPNLRDLQRSESLTQLLQRAVETRNSQLKKVPLFLKVAPDLNDEEIKGICKAISQKATKVDGLIVSNTTVTRDNMKTESDVKFETGGLSGRPLEKMSTELVAKFYTELRGEIPIIGVGGIWNGRDAFRKICAGASAVQIYTALTYKGPGAVERMKKELSELISENGFETVNDAVGSDYKQAKTK